MKNHKLNIKHLIGLENTSKDDIKKSYNLAEQERDITFARLPITKFSEVAEGSEEDLLEYYNSNKLTNNIGFITPLTNHFCANCNRVRITSTGRLYMCLGQNNFLH